MQIEYEATFPNIDKDDVRARLKAMGAIMERPDAIQRRTNFYLPVGDSSTSWARVRDEGGKVTMSIKAWQEGGMEGQKEIMLVVDDYGRACDLLVALGCKVKTVQETRRERWKFKDIEIDIDEWPHLRPFVEFDGPSEEAVKEAVLAAGFDYAQAIFGPVNFLYAAQYGNDPSAINTITPLLFDQPNPFTPSS